MGVVKKILKAECRISMKTVLGNHDIWGWHTRSGTTGSEARWGKGMALEALGMETPYWSFDCGGDTNSWHIVGLDSVQKFGESSFISRLDEEQFAWLESDLAPSSQDYVGDPATPGSGGNPALVVDGNLPENRVADISATVTGIQ